MDIENLMPVSAARQEKTLAQCQAISARYGLALTARDWEMLVRCQQEALRATGRVEFGEGPYEKLVYSFCNSPYISGWEYADTLAELCRIFYFFKRESGEKWSDDELIAAMAEEFGGRCQGSTQLMADRLWQALHEDPGDAEDEEDLLDQ